MKWTPGRTEALGDESAPHPGEEEDAEPVIEEVESADGAARSRSCPTGDSRSCSTGDSKASVNGPIGNAGAAIGAWLGQREVQSAAGVLGRARPDTRLRGLPGGPDGWWSHAAWTVA